MTSWGLSLPRPAHWATARLPAHSTDRGTAQQSWGDSTRKKTGTRPGDVAWRRLSSSKQNPHWSCPDGASHVELITIALNAQAWLVAPRARNEGAVPSTHRGTTPTPSSPGPRIPHPGDGDASPQPAADAVLRRQPEHGHAWPAQPRPVPSLCHKVLGHASQGVTQTPGPQQRAAGPPQHSVPGQRGPTASGMWATHWPTIQAGRWGQQRGDKGH